MTKTSNLDSWLDSRPPWSLSESTPFRPTSSTNASLAVDIARTPKSNSPIDLLAQFLRMGVIFGLEEISFKMGEQYGVKLGEGTTYVVEKRLLPKNGARLSERTWVAVKRPISIIPKDPNTDIAMPSDSLRRLKAILLELEVMFHPPLRSHPNIARLLGFSWDEEAPGYTPLLVMELASHGTLADFLSTENTHSDERRQLCIDITLGLEVLHDSMIVHGDVKQDNVLVFPHSSKRVIAKLSDFGLALLGDSDPVYRGTPIYNAPEIHRYSQQNDRQPFTVSGDLSSELLFKCDAFSFGLLCFETFMGGQKYYEIPETERFRAMLLAGAPDDAIFMSQAKELSRTALVPTDLTTDCRVIVESTLSSIPTLRLQNGWDDIKRVFGMQPLDTLNEASDMARSLRTTTDDRPSMLEFHDLRSFGGDILNSLISELKFLAISSEKREAKAQAAFDLCLLSTLSTSGTVLVEDTALDWLKKAQFHGHDMSCQLVPRIFGACQSPISAQIATEPKEDANRKLGTGTNASICWYSEAVRVRLGQHMRQKTVGNLQHLVFGEQLADVQLRERLMESTLDARFMESMESRLLLHLAVAISSSDILLHLLDNGANIDERTPSGDTALQISSIMGDLEMVKILVGRGADASINDSRDVSPLHWLVLFPTQHIDEAAQLLNSANANSQSSIDSTKLYFDDLGLVLEASPLYWAVMCRNTSVISALLRHYQYIGPTLYNTAFRTKSRQLSAVDAALGTVCADTLETLLQHHFLSDGMTDDEKQMCWRKVAHICSNKFQRWCIHGDHYEAAYTDVIAVFRRYGITYTNDFDQTINPWTPLIRSSISCNSAWAKALIKDGADINYRPLDNSGTAMECAILAAHFMTDIYIVIEFVKLLYDSGASMEPAPLNPRGSKSKLWESTHYRLGTLHLAVRHGAGIPLVQYLMQQVPEQINRKYEGEPLLNRVTAMYKEADTYRVASLLLAAGANPNAEGDHREGFKWTCCYTAASVAVRLRNWGVLKLLLDHDTTLQIGVSGAHDRSILHHALWLALQYEYRPMPGNPGIKEHLEIMDLLLSHPLSICNNLVNKLTSDGISPLMHAVIWALPAHVAILLNHGADISCEWQDHSLIQLIDRSRRGKIILPFVVDDEVFEESEMVNALEASISTVKRSEYISRLDKIENLLQR